MTQSGQEPSSKAAVASKGTSPANAASVKESASKKAASAAGASGGVIHYLQGVRAEWGKVIWPTPNQILAQTLVVLVVTAIMTLGVWGVDNLFSLLIQWVVPNR
ncbi:MAG: preprotein translocase subunit SecE [Candidatus Melainabacteria bacterium]|nr:preprotein translocase subunit SecE [Candidatus Melainabacteria bacterium]